MFVREIWRYPVNSRVGELMKLAQLSRLGIGGDRAVVKAVAVPEGNTRNQRPDYEVDLSPIPAGGQSINDWINIATFTTPVVGTLIEINLRVSHYGGPLLFQNASRVDTKAAGIFSMPCEFQRGVCGKRCPGPRKAAAPRLIVSAVECIFNIQG